MLCYCCYQTQIFGMAWLAHKDDISGARHADILDRNGRVKTRLGRLLAF